MRISDWSSDVCSSDLPESDLGEVVEHRHGNEHHYQVRRAALKDIHELHIRWGDALQVVSGHRHWRRQERGLQIEGNQDSKEQRVDFVVRQQWQKDRHEDDDDLRPFERPAEQERSEEHTSELQSLMRISYAVFCLNKKQNTPNEE